MRIAKHGEKDAVHAVTYYAVVETAHELALVVAQAGHRADASIARTHGAHRRSDRWRSETFNKENLADAWSTRRSGSCSHAVSRYLAPSGGVIYVPRRYWLHAAIVEFVASMRSVTIRSKTRREE